MRPEKQRPIQEIHSEFASSKKKVLKFRKMNGLGNDFIIIDSREDGVVLDKEQIIHICDRKRGVGADQLIFILDPKEPKADISVDMYNPDGGAVEACGNAMRCLAKILAQETGKNEGLIETVAGFLQWSAGEDLYSVNMGKPNLEWDQIPLAQKCDTLSLPIDGKPVAVNIGNPHCVFFVDDAEKVDLSEIGPKIENHALFPQRTNVEFVHIISSNHVRMRVWERGTGITEACGSGACAVMVAAVRRGLIDRKARITMDGGDLYISWREEDQNIIMTGPADDSFTGEITL